MDDLSKAIEILNNGGIVIFPTDTAFGIGCRIDREDSVRKLFSIRKRPKEMAVPVLCSSINMVEHYAKLVSKDVRRLMDNYWPGALTIVLECQASKVPELVRGGGQTIGVRIPNHETILELIKGTGVPILGPSANFHGEKTPYSFEELNPDLLKMVDFAIRGETKLKQASTVIDCSVNPFKILREGAVKISL